MDVLAAGGITPQHLAMMVQLWSQMMGQFFQHVRTYAAQAGAQQAAKAHSKRRRRKREPAPPWWAA
jgi:hypothetical protein